MSRRQRQNGDSNESWNGEGASAPTGDGRFPRVVAVLPDLYEFPGEKVDERAFAKKRRAAFGRTSVVALATFGIGVATSFAIAGFEPKTATPTAEPTLAEAETVLDPFAEAGVAVDLPTFAASDSPMRSVPENAGFANGNFDGSNDSFGCDDASNFAATSVRPAEVPSRPQYGVELDGNADFIDLPKRPLNGYNGRDDSAFVANVPTSSAASERADEAFPTWADLENSTAANSTPAQNGVVADTNAFSSGAVAWNDATTNGGAVSNVAVDAESDFNNADYNGYNDNAAQNASVAANFNDEAAARAGANRYSAYNRIDGGDFADFARNNGFVASENPSSPNLGDAGVPNVPTTVAASYPSASDFAANGSTGAASAPTYVARVPDEYLAVGNGANPNPIANVGVGVQVGGNVGAVGGGFNGYSTTGVANGSTSNGTNATSVAPARSLRW